MERLTDKKEAEAQRRGYENRLKNGYPRNIPEERFLKLAAYENTGLGPEDVKEHEAAYIEIMTRTYGPFRQKISKWMQAEKEGRLVVLPDVNECDRKAFVDGLQDYFQEASFYDPSTGIFGMSEGEKELASALMNALTCEEAEAALKKREEEDNEAD